MQCHAIFILHTGAIKRCYENLRRTHNEQKKDAEYTDNQSRRRKYRSRRQRVS